MKSQFVRVKKYAVPYTDYSMGYDRPFPGTMYFNLDRKSDAEVFARIHKHTGPLKIKTLKELA